MEETLRGNGWKKFFALTLLWMATALLTSAQTVTTLHSFSQDDGALPNFATPTGAALTVGSDGALYGVTSGTIFKITASGTFTKLYDLDQIHAVNAHGSLLQAADGNMYGTTDTGGALNQGLVFKLTPTGVLTVLHSFNIIDGLAPKPV